MATERAERAGAGAGGADDALFVLLVALAAALTRWRPPGRPAVVLLAPTVVFAAALVLLAGFRERLPAIAPPDVLARLSRDGGPGENRWG